MNNKRISMAARALVIGMVAALVLVGTAMGEISRTGLVGEWHFDGDAKDSSGNGNDGTIYGATFVEGKFGKALSFNGVNNYMSIPNVVNKQPEGSIEAWVNYNNPSAGKYGDYIFAASTGAPISRGSDGTNLGIHPEWGTDLRFGTWSTEVCDNWCWATSGTTPVSGQWYHVVGTWGSQGLKIYINGILKGTNSYSGPSFATNYNIIGASSWSDSSINGLIDEVRIYNRALSDSEVKANYEASKAPPAPQLTLTKSLSPSTITEGDSTTVTIRVENTGGDAKSVKITDAIPQGFTLVSGSASQEYSTLKATESRTFQYTVKATGTGRFVSDLATVTYQDEKGNSYSGASNSATITVQAGQTGQVPAAQPKTPGFGAILAGIGIILALAIRRR